MAAQTCETPCNEQAVSQRTASSQDYQQQQDGNDESQVESQQFLQGPVGSAAKAAELAAALAHLDSRGQIENPVRRAEHSE
jgi:hypothetical protein